MRIKAIYENGAFEPQEPVRLAERPEAAILISATTSLDVVDPTCWKAAEPGPGDQPTLKLAISRLQN